MSAHPAWVVGEGRAQRAAGALIAALLVGVGCSDNDPAAVQTTTSATTTGPDPCDFKVGDRISADVVGRQCMFELFDCADGRIHVTVDSGGGERLEGFLPTDQSGKPRADTKDAVWLRYGGEYQHFGRTKLQFDCGG